MEERKEGNRLRREKSPYLLQHARNPVDWFPWGEEAFTAARTLDRPIFLSIGYASCHWCHVMERESFEDPEVARLLNEHFISIKVDREELPEVDTLYMSALHAMGQPGGWPLNMFLDTALRPFYGGTYFPPEQRPGFGSFRQVLGAIARLWQADRAKIAETARQVQQVLSPSPDGAESENEVEVGREIDWMSLVRAAPAFLARDFDDRTGGFRTSGTNRFPPSMALMFLLRMYRRTADGFLLRMVERTLDAMRRGGIYDQVGGGLARYATDETWLVPHFEKMLYDNALFAQALVETFRVTQNANYRRWAEDVIDYVDRQMTSPDGVFFSSEDADQEGLEGQFYLWSRTEVATTLEVAGVPAAHAELVIAFWGVTDEGNFEGKNILHEGTDRATFAAEHAISESDLDGLIERARHTLRAARSTRRAPSLDDKVLLPWNALMISALARAGFAFGSPTLTGRATKAADRLKQLLFLGGRWMRRYRDGEARYPALLSDHALMGLACLDLYRATGQSEYYHDAIALAETMIEQFLDEGRIHEGRRDPALFARLTECYDGVQPSGPSAAVQLFAALARYGSNTTRYENMARAILGQFSAQVAAAPQAYPAMLSGALTLCDTPAEIVVTGGSELARIALDWIGQHMEAETILARSATTPSPPHAPTHSWPKSVALHVLQNLPLLEGKDPGRFGLFLCRNMQCEQPLTEPRDADDVTDRLRAYAARQFEISSPG